MFDLEQAIADWRRQMLAAGMKTPVPLAELESHLRDDVEHQMQAGVGQRPAFDAAVQRIGERQALTQEFRKMGAGAAKRPLFACFGFMLCSWLTYICLMRANHYANSAYVLWLSGDRAQQTHIAARCNLVWVAAALALATLAVGVLSATFRSRGPRVFRSGLGLILLALAASSVSVALATLVPLVRSGRPSAATAWSMGGVTFHGPQVYAALFMFGLAALSLLAGGLWLLLRRSTNEREDLSGESPPRISAHS